MSAPACSDVVVVGLGRAERGDDAVGLCVARQVRTRVDPGVRVLAGGLDAAALVDAWQGARLVLICDAVRSGSPPGRVHRIDALARPLPPELGAASTHGFGLAQAVELARALGRLPDSLWIYGIEGSVFGLGEPASPEVLARVPDVVERMLRDLATWRARGEAACTNAR